MIGATHRDAELSTQEPRGRRNLLVAGEQWCRSAQLHRSTVAWVLETDLAARCADLRTDETARFTA